MIRKNARRLATALYCAASLTGCAMTTTEGALASAPRAAPDVEAIARGEVDRLMADGASRATIVVIDPRDGRVLASVGRGPDGDAEALRVAEVGSTLKPLTVAAALDAGLDATRRFEGEGGRWRVDATTELRDAHPRETLDARDVLVSSSNVGAGKIVRAVGEAPIAAMFEAIGARVPSTGDWMSHGAGIGARLSVLELARAYGAFANGGTLIDPRGSRRLFTEDTARRVTDMLEAAVGDEGTGRRARVPGQRVAGKTGTTSDGGVVFAGLAPVDAPRFVIVVRAEQPGQYGGAVAAPSFARVAEALLVR